MTTFDIFAARDGDTYRGTIEAEDEDDAKAKARPILAEHFRIDFDEDDPDYFDGEIDGFTAEERPAKLYPLPIDLIVASRDVIAAFGGDVPDWIENEIGMLELALKPFADQPLPVPVEDDGPAEGDEMPIRRLEQREGAELHVLLAGFWTVLDEALGLDDIDPDESQRIVDDMMKRNIDDDSPAALVTVKRDGVIVELWASARYPDSEGVPFTCVWVKGELARTA